MSDKKQKYILEYTGISYLIIDDLWYWLTPDDGGILIKNINLGLLILLLIISIISAFLFQRKLCLAKNKKQFCIDNDIILEIIIVVAILSVSNIILKIKNLGSSIPAILITSKIVGCLFIIVGIIVFCIYVKKFFLNNQKKFSFFVILDHVENLIICSIIPVIWGILILR